jgi:hypothetical protein
VSVLSHLELTLAESRLENSVELGVDDVAVVVITEQGSEGGVSLEKAAVVGPECRDGRGVTEVLDGKTDSTHVDNIDSNETSGGVGEHVVASADGGRGVQTVLAQGVDESNLSGVDRLSNGVHVAATVGENLLGEVLDNVLMVADSSHTDAKGNSDGGSNNEDDADDGDQTSRDGDGPAANVAHTENGDDDNEGKGNGDESDGGGGAVLVLVVLELVDSILNIGHTLVVLVEEELNGGQVNLEPRGVGGIQSLEGLGLLHPHHRQVGVLESGDGGLEGLGTRDSLVADLVVGNEGVDGEVDECDEHDQGKDLGGEGLAAGVGALEVRILAHQLVAVGAAASVARVATTAAVAADTEDTSEERDDSKPDHP